MAFQQTPTTAEMLVGCEGSSGSDASGSSPEDSPLDARKRSTRASGSAMNGQRYSVMPDLLPKTPIERSGAPFLAFTKDGSSASIESQSTDEVYQILICLSHKLVI